MTSSEPLPKLDLSILELQLQDLYLKAVHAVRVHNAYLRERKVTATYYSQWYQWEFSETDSPAFNIDASEPYWSDTDRDGDYVSMSCPASVLSDEETPEQWAERTYARYLKSEEERKRREHEKWLATKDRRREQYERLKAEFEGGKTTGDAPGEDSSLRMA